jgi:hypothetical protein
MQSSPCGLRRSANGGAGGAEYVKIVEKLEQKRVANEGGPWGPVPPCLATSAARTNQSPR